MTDNHPHHLIVTKLPLAGAVFDNTAFLVVQYYTEFRAR
jgi:hypothetical protein